MFPCGLEMKSWGSTVRMWQVTFRGAQVGTLKMRLAFGHCPGLMGAWANQGSTVWSQRATPHSKNVGMCCVTSLLGGLRLLVCVAMWVSFLEFSEGE